MSHHEGRQEVWACTILWDTTGGPMMEVPPNIQPEWYE